MSETEATSAAGGVEGGVEGGVAVAGASVPPELVELGDQVTAAQDRARRLGAMLDRVKALTPAMGGHGHISTFSEDEVRSIEDAAVQADSTARQLAARLEDSLRVWENDVVFLTTVLEQRNAIIQEFEEDLSFTPDTLRVIGRQQVSLEERLGQAREQVGIKPSGAGAQ